MSQEFPSGGRRGAPQRDKEFFPAGGRSSFQAGVLGDGVLQAGVFTAGVLFWVWRVLGGIPRAAVFGGGEVAKAKSPASSGGGCSGEFELQAWGRGSGRQL